MGLLAAPELGLIRGYWVLITICVLLRPDIPVTLSRTALRIIGTIAGVELDLLILANVHDLWFLYCILFVFASVFYAVRNINYALCPYTFPYFNPWSICLVQIRILDTMIGAGLSLLGVLIIRSFLYLKR